MEPCISLYKEVVTLIYAEIQLTVMGKQADHKQGHMTTNNLIEVTCLETGFLAFRVITRSYRVKSKKKTPAHVAE